MSALFGDNPLHHAIPEDARAEVEQIFANLEAILAAAGAALTDVVRVGIVMRDLQRDRPVFNQSGPSGSASTGRPVRPSRRQTSAAKARTPGS